MKYSIVVILLVALSSVHAQNSSEQKEATNPPQEKILKYDTLLNYKKVTINKVLPDKIEIFHESGIATIPFDKIPEEVRANLGMTAKANAETLEKKKQNAAISRDIAIKKAALAKHRLFATGTIMQVLDNGVLLTNVSYTDGTKEKVRIPYKVKSGGPTTLSPNRPYTTTTMYKTEWKLKVNRMPHKIVYVECDSTTLVDGERFTEAIYPAPTYKYDSVGGARKTVPGYTTDIQNFLESIGK